MYRVVPTHAAVFAGEPVSAALAKDDVSRHDKFGGCFFGAETFSGALGGLVGSAFGGVGCVSEGG